MFKKITILFFLLMMFSSFVYSEIIEEKTLYDLGYQNIIIEKNDSTCFDIKIPVLQDTLRSTFVFVIDIENYIPVTDGVIFKIYLNEILEDTIESKDIKKRNVIYLYNYNSEENNIGLCVENSFLPRIIIDKQSKIGNYHLAKITEEDLYQIVPHTTKTDTLTPIDIIFRNSGAAPAHVKVENSTDRYLINNLLNHISGEYEYEGILNAGEEKRIRYFIKTKEDLLYASARAKLTYINEFGEFIEIITVPSIINVEKKTALFDIFIDAPADIYTKTDSFGTIILRNTSVYDVSNLYIEVDSSENIELLDKRTLNISKYEVVEIPFRIKPSENDDFLTTFIISYFSNDENYTQTESIKFNVTQKYDSLFEIMGVLLLIFIVLYIWFLKE